MVTLGEVLSLAIPRGAIMEKVWLLWVFRSLENAFAAIVHLEMLSDIMYITHRNKSMYFYANIFIHYFVNPKFHLKLLFLGHIYT